MRLVKLTLEKPRGSRAGAPRPRTRDVSAQGAGAEEAELTRLAETERAANSETDLLSRDGLDE